MKNFRFHILLFTFLVLGGAFSIQAQNTQASRKYRVVAYKNGNPSVTSTSNITEVVPYMSIFIPNSFTPNGDGKNDTFSPLLFGDVEQFNFIIYDRWGQIVFQTTSRGKKWDGSYAGQSRDSNVFVWLCNYKLRNEPARSQKGTVLLIR